MMSFWGAAPKAALCPQMLMFRLLGVAAGVSLVNPVPLFDATGAYMDAHDGNIRQWTAGGPFFYYAMAYSRCRFHGFHRPLNCPYNITTWRRLWMRESFRCRAATTVTAAAASSSSCYNDPLNA